MRGTGANMKPMQKQTSKEVEQARHNISKHKTIRQARK